MPFECKLTVPVYVGQPGVDFSQTEKDMLYLYEEGGLRVCLGGPRESQDRPDVTIERAVDCWRVFIHPSNGDPDYVIEIRPESTRVENDHGDLIHETLR